MQGLERSASLRRQQWSVAVLGDQLQFSQRVEILRAQHAKVRLAIGHPPKRHLFIAGQSRHLAFRAALGHGLARVLRE